MDAPRRRCQIRVRFQAIGIKTAGDSILIVTGDIAVALRHALVGVQTAVEQAEHYDRQRKSILGFAQLLRRLAGAKGFGGDKARGKLVGWKVVGIPFNRETIAIDYCDICAAPVHQ